MLIEVKVKVTENINDKKRKRLEVYVLEKDFFSEAEYAVTEQLNQQQSEGTVEEFEIQALKISTLKEICTQFQGDYAYIATLKDCFHDDEGNEKYLRYKVLLWADDLGQATTHARSLQRQGYDMQVEGLKEVDYTYLTINHAQ